MDKIKTLVLEAEVKWVKYAIIFASLILAITFSTKYFLRDELVAYGDAESHLNIAKRVVQSLTPGMAQLGGVWLPLPHLMLVPFVSLNYFWRSGIAGSIISGICYLVSALYIFNLIFLLTKNKVAGILGSLIFMLNPNVLYMQSTAMTELPLIVFFLLSIYYFADYLINNNKLESLLLTAFFGFAASLTRYDGWFLVIFEALGIGLFYGIKYLKRPNLKKRNKTIGLVTLYSTLAFFGIFLWFLWDWLILGDPLYFTSSPFSAKSQQMGWLSRGQLPAYHNWWASLLYYTVTFVQNAGLLISGVFVLGIILFILDKRIKSRYLILMVLLVPFIFYVITLYLGQSVIFIPALTPASFEWRLFNVRYGLMMVPAVAILSAYYFGRVKFWPIKILIILAIATQYMAFALGNVQAISETDALRGLSSAKRTDAERWLSENYTGGLVLIDDFARTVSILRSNVPMENTIYIGNKPYWDESLVTPEKYATWIIVQKDDALWNAFYATPEKQERLFTYYKKAYTSPVILIFERMK